MTNKSCSYRFRTLRENARDPRLQAMERFGAASPGARVVDARFVDARGEYVSGWIGHANERPLLRALGAVAELQSVVSELAGPGSDWALIEVGNTIRLCVVSGLKTVLKDIPAYALNGLLALRRESERWPGTLDDKGEHLFDPRTPSPGTHFRANLLIGDRAGQPNPLLTTPKAIVDEWGRGSSRAHSDKQVLATRWDLVPEENGFPANRQFYLLENGLQIFYSAAPDASSKVATRHAANHTVITYLTPDGLELERTIFVAPAEVGLPLAVEAQVVTIRNRAFRPRRLDLVMTGMFGFTHPGALTVDVIYTCVTVEPGVLESDNKDRPLVIAPRYTAGWGMDDRPFNVTQLVDSRGRISYPSAFCLDYRRFIGNGSLERPEFVGSPDNAFPRKGPAFFALTLPLNLEPGGECECQSFSGLVSRCEGGPVTDEVMSRRMEDMAARVSDPQWAHKSLGRVVEYQDAYRGALQIHTPEADVNRLVNVHLPFQVRYQTYASRSFGLTQKGFRQIGFREIQDLFAAMPFEVASGRLEHVADLIGTWAAHVHEFGYADHQFYWTGMEPGRYSDDALWLFQAVGRLTDLTGDAAILDRAWPVAGTDKSRTLYETLQAILRYSGRVSIGRHGLPLIDRADWNDTLNLDGEGMHGPQKEALYRKQLSDGVIRSGEGIQTDLSESVMNGFLLEIARAYMVRFAEVRGDRAVADEWASFGTVLKKRLQDSWRDDFFARAFINRENQQRVTYLGARGDGLSADPAIPGTYFLNSFSWSVLSGIATDEQIAVMLDRIEAHLVTAVGIRLSSPTRFDVLMGRSGSGDYAYGDRENGGVFKHAAMMAVMAMLEAARRVKCRELAERLFRRAWETLRVTAPFVAMTDPYVLGGNPRFCTQYVNPATGEHVGPLLSGTAPWMWLCYLNMLGVSFREGRVVVSPLLPLEWTDAMLSLRVPSGEYRINIHKPCGFFRSADKTPEITCCGRQLESEVLPACEGKPADVEVAFTT